MMLPDLRDRSLVENVRMISSIRRGQYYSIYGNDGLSEFNCFLGRGYGTICLTLGVELYGAGRLGFWLIILIIWFFWLAFCPDFLCPTRELIGHNNGEGAKNGKRRVFNLPAI